MVRSKNVQLLLNVWFASEYLSDVNMFVMQYN